MKKNKAFSLAETLITLAVLGLLSAALVPIAFRAKPDEDLMLFKKYHTVITSAIQEMGSSDKYFKFGDLTKKPDGTYVDGTCYIAQALADIMGAKKVACKTATITHGNCATTDCSYSNATGMATFKTSLSTTNLINAVATKTGGGFQTSDKVTVLISNVQSRCKRSGSNATDYAGDILTEPYCKDENGIDTHYDGIVGFYIGLNFDITEDNIINTADAGKSNVAPNNTRPYFVYAFRPDGKIITSTKVDEWLNRKVE